MALHRDIFWVGRQWAVTGFGLQAVNQKLKGKFDIEAKRVWEEGLLENMRAEAWLNADDFGKALTVARKRFPEPPSTVAPPQERVLGPIEKVVKEPGSKEKNSKQIKAKEIGLKETGLKEKSLKEDSVEATKPQFHKFDMRIEGSIARFVPQWRIRVKR
jgi:hypothetical protein